VGTRARANGVDAKGRRGKRPPTTRPAARGEAVKRPPPIRMTLDRALSWIQDDELVEVTPKSIRLRKMYLDPNERKRYEKARLA